MSARFDSVAMVDWSAAATPVTGADSVWLAIHRVGAARAERLVNPPTRAAAMADLGDWLAAEAAAGRRVLAGFDFPFGYPRGAVDRIAPGEGPAWARLWALLAARIRDGADNANDRFDVAERLNTECFDGGGPYWGRPPRPERAALPMRKPAGYGARYPPERRLIDRLTPKAQPVWKLYTTGSVGSQAIMGMAALERLRRDPLFAGRIAVWPFEPIERAPVALAEVYPSVYPLAPFGPVKDAAQVLGVAAALAQAAQRGALSGWLAAPDRLAAVDRAAVRREEAWILGVDADGGRLA